MERKGRKGGKGKAAIAAAAVLGFFVAAGAVLYAAMPREPKGIPVSMQEEVEYTVKELTPEEAEALAAESAEEDLNTVAPGDEAPPEELPHRIWYNNECDADRYDGIPMEQMFRFRYWLESYLGPYAERGEDGYYHVTFDNESYGGGVLHPSFYITVDELPDVRVKCTYTPQYEEFHFSQEK